MGDPLLARSVAQQVDAWMKDVDKGGWDIDQERLEALLASLAERERQLVALVKETYDDHGDPWNRAGDTFSGRCQWCKRAEVFLIDPPVTPTTQEPT